MFPETTNLFFSPHCNCVTGVGILQRKQTFRGLTFC